MLADAADPARRHRGRHRGRAAHAGPASGRGRVHPGVLRAGAARPRRRGAGGAGTGPRRPRRAATSWRSASTTSVSSPGAAATWRRRAPITSAGLAAAPGDPALLHGRAKVLAAAGPGRRGDHRLRPAHAARAAAAVPARVRRAAGVGRPVAATAQAQYRLARRAAAALRRAGLGRRPDRRAAGRRSRRPAPRRSGWPRPSGSAGRASSSADALAWALHAAGRDAEALPLIEQAGALGRRDATVDYHRGMILAAARVPLAPARRSPRWTRPGHQPALLPAARVHRPADPGDPARCRR